MQWCFEQALLPTGWARDVALTLSADGRIESLTPDTPGHGVRVPGIAVPGIVNAHSHAFQRALLGLTEHRASERDSFWSWREAMYALAQKLTPDDLLAVAAQLYVEMLKGGYTSVCEFHYLHDAVTGSPLAMGEAVIAAAGQAGLGLTLLPTLYQTGDFGGAAPSERQRRFVLDTDAYLVLRQDLAKRAPGPVGCAIHSLRAVPPASLNALLEALKGDENPIHIHIAEQPAEVARCLETTGARPVEWLLANAPVDARWSLIHATHVTPQEVAGMAQSGAAVVLCPTTEANLGDGIFPAPEFLAQGGRIAIGSDSHVSLSIAEELRLLEYGQRLTRLERNVLADKAEPHVGARLYRAAAAGGAQASGLATGALAVGMRADIVVLDDQAPVLFGRNGDQILDAYVFGGIAGAVRDVMVAGQWRLRDGRHAEEEAIAAAYRAAITRLNAL